MHMIIFTAKHFVADVADIHQTFLASRTFFDPTPVSELAGD